MLDANNNAAVEKMKGLYDLYCNYTDAQKDFWIDTAEKAVREGDATDTARALVSTALKLRLLGK